MFASDGLSVTENVDDTSKDASMQEVDISDVKQLEKMSDNLKSNNPFIPFKTLNESNADTLVQVDVSNFEFFSVVKYADHLEFGLKEKNSGQEFWLSSKQDANDAKIGVHYWSFSPLDRVLVVQDIIHGDLIRIVQVEPNFDESKSSSSSDYGSDSSWSSLLDLDEDDDDISMD